MIENTLALGAEMLVMGGRAKDEQQARAAMKRAIDSGDAARTMERMIEAQKGDPRVVGDTSIMPLASVVSEVKAERAGWVATIDALAIGRAAVTMGAGRTRADDAVDPAVGIEVLAKPGAKVEQGQPLAKLYARRKSEDAEARVKSAFTIGQAPPSVRPLVIERVV